MDHVVAHACLNEFREKSELLHLTNPREIDLTRKSDPRINFTPAFDKLLNE